MIEIQLYQGYEKHHFTRALAVRCRSADESSNRGQHRAPVDLMTSLTGSAVFNEATCSRPGHIAWFHGANECFEAGSQRFGTDITRRHSRTTFGARTLPRNMANLSPHRCHPTAATTRSLDVIRRLQDHMELMCHGNGNEGRGTAGTRTRSAGRRISPSEGILSQRLVMGLTITRTGRRPFSWFSR